MYYNPNKVIIQYLDWEQHKVLDFLIEPVTDDKPQKDSIYGRH